jgi:hypothetical protein
MNLIKKYGPYIAIGLLGLALGFLFLPYVRGGESNRYYAIGYEAIFNIKESRLPSNVTSGSGPSAMLIIAFVLVVLSLVALPFFKKDPTIAFMAGIATSLAGLIFFFGQLIMVLALNGIIAGTFGLYLVATLVSCAGVISLLAGIQYLRDHKQNEANNRYSYINK